MTFLDRFVKLFDINVSKNFDESLTIAFGKLEVLKNNYVQTLSNMKNLLI